MNDGVVEMSEQVATEAFTRRLLRPPHETATPVIICLHGSGESCSPSWDTLASELSKAHCVLLLDRNSALLTPSVFGKMLPDVLRDTNPPYVLIAHSYGGAFARCILDARPNDVAGMVLVETGQESVWDSKIEQRQNSRQALGSRPLSVIRGNSLITKFKELESLESDGKTLDARRQTLQQWDKEDGRLKKAQLALSKNHRYIHLPDCGHGVVRERPDVVIEQVKWVMQNLDASEQIQRSKTLQNPFMLMISSLSKILGRGTR